MCPASPFQTNSERKENVIDRRDESIEMEPRLKKKAVAHLLFDRAAHPLEDPHYPTSFNDFPDKPKLPPLVVPPIVRSSREEELEEPFRDVEQAKVVLVCDLWSLGLDVLEKRCEKR